MPGPGRPGMPPERQGRGGARVAVRPRRSEPNESRELATQQCVRSIAAGAPCGPRPRFGAPPIGATGPGPCRGEAVPVRRDRTGRPAAWGGAPGPVRLRGSEPNESSETITASRVPSIRRSAPSRSRPRFGAPPRGTEGTAPGRGGGGSGGRRTGDGTKPSDRRNRCGDRPFRDRTKAHRTAAVRVRPSGGGRGRQGLASIRWPVSAGVTGTEGRKGGRCDGGIVRVLRTSARRSSIRRR